MSIGIFGKEIGIDLYPEIIKRIRTVVGVMDFFGSNDALALVIQFHTDVIIRTLLPVCISRST